MPHGVGRCPLVPKFSPLSAGSGGGFLGWKERRKEALGSRSCPGGWGALRWALVHAWRPHEKGTLAQTSVQEGPSGAQLRAARERDRDGPPPPALGRSHLTWAWVPSTERGHASEVSGAPTPGSLVTAPRGLQGDPEERRVHAEAGLTDCHCFHLLGSGSVSDDKSTWCPDGNTLLADPSSALPRTCPAPLELTGDQGVWSLWGRGSGGVQTSWEGRATESRSLASRQLGPLSRAWRVKVRA